MIEKDRGRDWGHVKWAKQVAQMALGFGDTQCHFLDVVLENTPEVLQDHLADHYTTWAEFETDVAKTSASQLLRVKQCITNERKLREDVNKLQTSSGHKVSAPPSQTAQPSFSLPSTYRYNPCFTPNLNLPPQTAPTYQTAPPNLSNPQPPQPPPPMLPPQTPQNPFNTTMSVPRTNLFYGYQGGYPQTPS